MREYRDGDDLRRIHWPATARTGDLMVRQEDRPAKRRAVVLLDSAPPAHGGSGAEQLVRVVRDDGGLRHRTPRRRGVCRPPPDRRTPAPTPGPTTTRPSTDGLETLARVSLGGDDGPAGGAARRRTPSTSQGGLVVYVGGPLGDDDARTLAALRQPGSTGAAMVVDPDAFSGRGQRSGEVRASAHAGGDGRRRCSPRAG